MSLLLEALKRAEKAKDDAQRRAQGGDAGGDSAAATFDNDSIIAAQGRQVTKRDQLPDISAPLEILSEDLRPTPENRAAPSSFASRPGADAGSTERTAAKKVFEAKFGEPDPGLPFNIAIGVLGVLTAGIIAYFWIQLRPAPPLVNINPVRSASEKPVVAAAENPPLVAAAPAAPSTTAAPAIPSPPIVPTIPSTSAAPTMVAAPAVAPAPAGPKPAAGSSSSAAPSRSAAKEEDRLLSVTRGAAQIHPQVNSGYIAYQSGDLAKARAEYQHVLREEPANRDALLGLAAVEMRAQRHDLSDMYYQRILRADPRDPHAQAGLLALRGQQLDPVLVESRVKSLLAADRDANVLYFTLGNQYALQGRWAEAQQAYFKAFAADPDNADFAFNLAVSLDQLRLPALALEYYGRALALAEKRAANFALETARARVQQLSR